MSAPRVIAFDGPAASGKSTIARAVARALGCLYVDTGAMYRAYAWQALQDRVDVSSRGALLAWLPSVNFEARVESGAVVLLMNGKVLEDAWLRTEEVNRAVSPVATVPEVRSQAVAAQRGLLRHGDLVMEGRDIGTVVFPDAAHKFFIDVDAETRAARRAAQGLHDTIAERDRIDSTRAAAPLRRADGAVVINNCGTPQDAINQVLAVIGGGLKP